MTGVVERNLSQSQILKGIRDKNTVVPKDFFDDFQISDSPRKKPKQKPVCFFLVLE